MREFPIFREINDLHTATGYHEKTPDPHFHVFNSKLLQAGFIKSMPPYRQDYYQVGLNHEMTGTTFSLQSQQINSVNNLLFFVAPGQVITWEVADVTDGFLLYFKKEFFQFYRGNIDLEFPFFKVTDANYVWLDPTDSNDLYEKLVELRKVFETRSPYQREQLQGLTLAFLFNCKGHFESFQKNQKPLSRQQEFYHKFLGLVNRFFLEYHNVEEYSAILNVTPNHLSSVIKSVSGKSPKTFLDERKLSESKNLLIYSTDTISEIAYKLSFNEPTHFIRFFKKITGHTPLNFRQQASNRPS